MDKKALRKQLIQERLDLPDREQRADLLQRVMRIWLFDRKDTVIGAYWPIKGEFDPLPALHRWKEDGELVDAAVLRRIGLPVVDKLTKTLTFHAWYPGCDMEEDAYNIPKPKDTEVVVPTLLFVPCVGYGPGGYRLGYGGGFYDRTLAQLQPSPFTVGLGLVRRCRSLDAAAMWKSMLIRPSLELLMMQASTFMQVSHVQSVCQSERFKR